MGEHSLLADPTTKGPMEVGEGWETVNTKISLFLLSFQTACLRLSPTLQSLKLLAKEGEVGAGPQAAILVALVGAVSALARPTASMQIQPTRATSTTVLMV